MITTIDELLDTFRNYATASAGVDFIFMSPNAERPVYPYGVIQITQLQQMGGAGKIQKQIVGDDFVQQNDALFSGVVDFDIKSISADQAILDLINGTNLTTYDELNGNGIGYIAWQSVVDLTGIEVEKTIKRFRVSLLFNVVITAEQVTPFIKSVQVNNLYIGG